MSVEKVRLRLWILKLSIPVALRTELLKCDHDLIGWSIFVESWNIRWWLSWLSKSICSRAISVSGIINGSLFLVSAPVNEISIRETLICANLNSEASSARSGVVIKILSTEGIFLSGGGLDAKAFSPDPWSRMYFGGEGSLVYFS